MRSLPADIIWPQRTLYLTDVRLAQIKHTDAGLTDAASDRVGQLTLQNRLLEWETGPVFAACKHKLT